MVHIGTGEARETPHREFQRHDENFLIVPYELQPYKHRGWSVAVMHDQGHGVWYRYWFDLTMPDRPEGPLPWSDWIRAVPKKEWEYTDAMMVRYRWVLNPRNQTRVYQP